MEDEYHELDRAVVSEEESRLRGGASYSHFVDDVEKAKTMKETLDRFVFTAILCSSIHGN